MSFIKRVHLRTYFNMAGVGYLTPIPTSAIYLIHDVQNILPINIQIRVRLVVDSSRCGYDQHHKSNPHLLSDFKY